MSTRVIPQANPGASYLAYQAEIDAVIIQVLSGGKYIQSEQVTAFEEEFARYIGVPHAIGVGNGTDALFIALKACGIKPGDVVLTVSHTAVATIAAIEMAGATPMLIDVEPITFTIDPNHLELTIKKNKRFPFRAIVPVHLYGQPADLTAILEIAHRHDLHVIEDCAQSHGAVLNGKKTGASGHMASFSFYPTKNLGAFGDGGSIVTSDPYLVERARRLHEYGWEKRFNSLVPGVNSRLDELQAAILRVKLRYLDQDNECRRKIAQLYNVNLSDLSELVTPLQQRGKHIYHQYVVRTKFREKLRAFLDTKSIHTSIHYPLPVHLQPAYLNRTPLGVGGLPATEALYKEILSLPMYPQLSSEQVREITEQINRFFSDI